MSDDLVKRMRSIHNAADCDQAADRIEALTAKVAELEACLERQGSGHREDLDEIANVSVERLRRAKAAEAERDRLRGGIEYVLDGYGLKGPDYRFQDGEDGDWITDQLIAALKGESHD